MWYNGSGFNNDMFNAKKPTSSDYPSMLKILSWMKKNNIKTLNGVLVNLREKWKAIQAQESSGV